jgi:DNA-binding response OmpR family regulator
MNRNGTILIVDDEPNIRLGFRTALTTAGYSVDEAETGPVALDMLACASRDLVLLDLLLTGLSGMEVLRRLRVGANESSVVIVTAHGTVPDAVAAMKLGAVDVLSKPIAPTELRRVVGDVLAWHAGTRRRAEARHASTQASNHRNGRAGRRRPDSGEVGFKPPRIRPCH